MEKKRYVIRYSSVTGKAVWIYKNLSKEVVRKAYHRACKREMERVRNWSNMLAQRKANILSMLAKLMESLPVISDLPPEKEKAAKLLANMAKVDIKQDKEFYEHVMNERSKRNHAKGKSKV